jgi:mycofactocin precursor
MEQDIATLEPVADPTTDETEAFVEDELLVEEISIDGMCGVY